MQSVQEALRTVRQGEQQLASRRPTDVLWLVVSDDVCEGQVPGDDGDLVRVLIGVVEGGRVGPPEQQHPCAALPVVDGAHVQRCVAARVARVHVRPVEQKLLQVLDQAVLARLVHLLPALRQRTHIQNDWFKKKSVSTRGIEGTSLEERKSVQQIRYRNISSYNELPAEI